MATGLDTAHRTDSGPRRIRQLSASVINKIAAGEVIERPASVVKELVENALDAGATRIDVAVAGGGTTLVRVVDNGGGIEAEDFPLAVASHATSKIASADDLFQVSTLGFRGEALASIAEISRLVLRSRTRTSTAAQRLEVVGGQIGPLEPCAGPEGTSIEVHDLFFNTPVRRKFLRSSSTEIGHVSETFLRLAIPHPQVHFTLRHNDRLLHELPPAPSLRERVAKFFGEEISAALIPVESHDAGCWLRGYVAHPSQNRSHPRAQYLFLNGRCIRDRSLQHALTEAYRGLLLSGRYPIAFLQLDLPADAVDVNVHPTKLEVRFQDGGRLYSQLLGTLRTKFLTTDLNARVTGPGAGPAGAGSTVVGSAATRHPVAGPSATGPHSAQSVSAPSTATEGARVSHATAPFAAPVSQSAPGPFAATGPAAPFSATGPAMAHDTRRADEMRQELVSWAKGEVSAWKRQGVDDGPVKDLFQPPLDPQNAPRRPLQLNPVLLSPSTVTPSVAGHSAEAAAPVAGVSAGLMPERRAAPALGWIPKLPTAAELAELNSQSPDSPARRAIAAEPAPPASAPSFTPAIPAIPNTAGRRFPGMQVHNRYLVTECDEGLLIIDQHALHERILYQKLRQRVAAGPLESQALLVPEPVDLSPAEAAALLAEAEVLSRLGLRIEAFGGSTLLVLSYPAMLRRFSPAATLRDIAERLLAGGQPQARDLLDELLNMMSCKAAVKAGDPLSPEEISALLEQRELVQDSHHCPHGRPTSLVFSCAALDRQFLRT